LVELIDLVVGDSKDYLGIDVFDDLKYLAWFGWLSA